jgi:hypothetical protein
VAVGDLTVAINGGSCLAAKDNAACSQVFQLLQTRVHLSFLQSSLLFEDTDLCMSKLQLVCRRIRRLTGLYSVLFPHGFKDHPVLALRRGARSESRIGGNNRRNWRSKADRRWLGVKVFAHGS